VNFRTQFSHVFGIEWAIALGVFVLVGGALVVAVIVRRARPGVEPSRKEKYSALETGFLGLVFAAFVFLVVMTSSADAAEHTSAGSPVMTVRITAFQWCWDFTYPGTGRSVTGNCTPGRYPTLVLPVGRTVEVDITSNDVIHEWWVPGLDYKIEALPDHWNHFELRLTHVGEWVGRCSEFCGLYHDTMFFELRAVSQSTFAQWLAPSPAAGSPAAGTPLTGSHS
jgi:cytochrome c oxidase subunit 2